MLNLNNLNEINSLGAKQSVSPWYKDVNLLLNNIPPAFVHKYDLNRYYNTTDGETSFPFIFTRPTNAQYFDSVGDLVWADANMLANSQPVANATWGLSGATSTAGQVDPFGGTTGARLVAGNGTSTILNDSNGSVRLAPSMTVISGQAYTIVFYAKADVVTAVRVREPVASGARAKIDLITGVITAESGSINSITAGILVTATPEFNGWWKISCTRKVTSTSYNMDIKPGIDVGDGVSGLFVSSAMVHPYDGKTKKFLETTGTAKYCARFDYDPATLLPRGYLEEESKTNLSSIYGEFGQSGYQYGGIVGNPTQGITGFGKQFHRITGDGVLGQHFCSGGASASIPTASTIYTSSVFVKQGTQSLVQLTASAQFVNTDVFANFDLSNGTVGTVGVGTINPTIMDYGNGIYRISISYTTIAVPAAGAAVLVYMITALTDTRAPSNSLATTLDLFGYQIELGSVATSVIPTYGVAATRGADTPEMALGTWFTQGSGTVMIEYLAPKNPSGLFPPLLTFDDNTGNNRIQSFFQTNATNINFGTRIDDATVMQVNTTTPGTINYLSTATAIVSYATNNTRMVQNGGLVTLDATCTIPLGLSTMRVGKSIAATTSIRWIKSITFWPTTSASDAQLQDITTP